MIRPLQLETIIDHVVDNQPEAARIPFNNMAPQLHHFQPQNQPQQQFQHQIQQQNQNQTQNQNQNQNQNQDQNQPVLHNTPFPCNQNVSNYL